MAKWIVAVVLLLGAALVGLELRGGYLFGNRQGSVGETDEVPVVAVPRAEPARRVVSSLGRLEPAEGIVRVTSPLIGERLVELLAAPGDRVSSGQLLARLDDTFLRLQLESAQLRRDDAARQLEAERQVAAARLQRAETALAQADATSQYQEALHEAQMELRRLNARHAERLRSRLAELHAANQQLVSQLELEEQDLLVARAAAEVATAELSHELARREAQFAVRAATAEREVAAAGLRLTENTSSIAVLDKQVETAEVRLEQAAVRAPVDGVVLDTHLQPGEFLAEVPILQLADLDRMACIAEVFDGDVQHVRIGQPVEVRSRAFRGPRETALVTGVVERIGNSVRPATMRPLDPYQPVDRHVVEVRVLLDDARAAARLINEQPAGLVNLQVEVTFLDTSLSAGH